ncbi:MAG: replicative DNA helicase [Syntrophomonadales bacterium]|jgi:replicative DNA helicase
MQKVQEEILVDLESERRVLSGMLNSEEARIEAYDSIKEEDFYHPLHRMVFSLICQLYKRDVKPTFAELLKESQKLNLFRNQQDISELAYIAEHFIEGENITYWLGRVKDRAKLRKFESFLRRYHQKIRENQESVEELLMGAEEELTNLTALENDDHVDTPAQLANLGYEEVERRYLRFKEINEINKGVLPLDGLPTGFDSLNNVTLGYKPGDLIILGAQTGHGKTAFALHTAKSVTIEHKTNLLYLNTEMSRVQIALRWGSILSQVEHEKLRSGDLTSGEFSRVLQGYSHLSSSGFYSYPCPNLTPEKIVSIARKFKAQYDIKMLILDYVGRMEKISANYAEWQILEQVVKTQKMLAQNLGIAVMCLVQLNEDGTLQGARRMKNECDLMLKMVPVSNEEIEQNEKLRKFRDVNYRLIVDKNRDGKSGIDIMIHFDKTRQIMRDAQLV